MEFIRISLNLFAYFQDYRQVSRICIKNDIKTIKDLEKYIVKLFNIEENFYLLCKNCYLPSSENIQLLDDNDLIYVMPNYQQESHVEERNLKNTKKSKMKHKSTANSEELDVAVSPKAKKKKSMKNYDVNENNEVETKIKKIHKKLKCKKNDEIDSQVNINNIEMETDIHVDDINYEVETETEKDKKIKHKKNDENDSQVIMKNIELESDLSNKSVEQNKEISNMEVNETDIQTNGKAEICDNVEVNPRKRRRCITPKTQSCRVTASEIFAIEKRFKNREHSNLVQEIGEKHAEIPDEEELQNKKIESNPKIVESVEVLNIEKKLKQLDNSPENRKKVTDFTNETLNNTPNSRIAIYKKQKQLFGIGNILKLITSDNSPNEDSDETIHSEKDFITKRRRTRTRNSRKNKTETSITESLSESPVFKSPTTFKPPKTIAAPKSHIKFTNGETENDSKSSLVHSTPKLLVNNNKKVEIVNKNAPVNVVKKMSVFNVDQFNCVELPGNPSVDSVIMFKKLIIGENYTPKISNYILGKITNVTESGKISVHVLGELKERLFNQADGHDELKEPTGRFSCVFDENSQIEDKFDPLILDLNALIEPKLLQGYV